MRRGFRYETTVAFRAWSGRRARRQRVGDAGTDGGRSKSRAPVTWACQSGEPPVPLDAITDVAGVEVGHTTLISGSGKLVVGKGPVRTGVTVIHPRGKANPDPVFGAWFTLNGNGGDDRDDVASGVGHPRRADRDHEHAQRRCRARRDSAVAGREARHAAVGTAHRRRDVRRWAERHQRLSRSGPST